MARVRLAAPCLTSAARHDWIWLIVHAVGAGVLWSFAWDAIHELHRRDKPPQR